MTSNRVMIIGLDAVTFRLLQPWIYEGRLPNLKKFMDKGAYGALRSTIPPNSPAAWSTFATGVNPGGHGILSFHQFLPNDYDPHLTTAANRTGQTFWEIAGRHGKRGGIMNLPYTFPPRTFNGFMISGMLTPSVSHAMASPPMVFDDLIEAAPDYVIDADILGARGQDPEKMLDKILAICRIRLKAAIGLYRKHRPELFCVVFVAADRACHYFLPYMKMADGALSATQKRLVNAIAEVYKELDNVVGALVEEAGSETDVILLSDHGSCHLDKGLSLRNALAEAGLLALQKKNVLRHAVKSAVINFARCAPRSFKKRLEAALPGLSKRAVGAVAHANIDFRHTLAYPTGLARGIFINLKGRQPQGIVEPEDYETVRDRVINVFSKLRDPETGLPAMRHCHKREQLYSGARLEEMPDVILEPADNGYSMQTFSEMADRDVFYPLPEADWTKLNLLGGHDPEGILMAMGPHIRPGEVSGAKIEDVPATVLALLGCPAPAHFEGRILTEIVTGIAQETGSPAESGKSDGDGTEMTTEERAMVEERLRNLGYS